MIKNPFTEKIDQFLKHHELSLRRQDLIEDLRGKGFAGSDSKIISDYKWLLGKSEPEKPDPKPDQDDKPIREPDPFEPENPPQDEPEDNKSFELRKDWLK